MSVVVDSVAALVPKAGTKLRERMGDSHVGTSSYRLMSQALRKLAGSINKSKCVTIL